MSYTLITIIAVLLVILCLVTLVLFRLNSYISKLENSIIEARDRIENLTQSFKNVLVDETYLLDTNKLKKDLFQVEKPLIYNGENIDKKVKTETK